MLLERKDVDFVVAYDNEKPGKQMPEFFYYPTENFTKTEARRAATVELKRRADRGR